MNKLDKSTFEKMFKNLFEPLCYYAHSILGDMEQSRDVVQQSFVKLWHKRDTMDLSRPVKAYLYTSVRNTSINYIRDQKKFQSSVLDVEVYDKAQKNHAGSEPLELVASELADKIQFILAKMPEKSRAVFNLSRQEKLTYNEIAEKLDVSVKTVEAHMSRALFILRKELKDYLLTFVLTFLVFRYLVAGFIFL